VAYEIRHEVVKPDSSLNNSWLNPNVLHNNMNRGVQHREIALFTTNELVGFEEILRRRLLNILKKELL